MSNFAQSLPWHGGSFSLEAPRYVTGKVRSRSKFGGIVGFWPLLSPLAGQKRPADQLPILARGAQSFERCLSVDLSYSLEGHRADYRTRQLQESEMGDDDEKSLF